MGTSGAEIGGRRGAPLPASPGPYLNGPRFAIRPPPKVSQVGSLGTVHTGKPPAWVCLRAPGLGVDRPFCTVAKGLFPGDQEVEGDKTSGKVMEMSVEKRVRSSSGKGLGDGQMANPEPNNCVAAKLAVCCQRFATIRTFLSTPVSCLPKSHSHVPHFVHFLKDDFF